MLISPISTFQSWGSSLIFVSRSQCPIGVIRSSSLQVTGNPAWLSALSYMVRNLSIRNGCPFFPIRGHQ